MSAIGYINTESCEIVLVVEVHVGQINMMQIHNVTIVLSKTICHVIRIPVLPYRACKGWSASSQPKERSRHPPQLQAWTEWTTGIPVTLRQFAPHT